MVALLALLPWPAQGRAKLELRGYTMNMAVNIWRHGSLREDTKVWIKEVFVGWAYYKMWPFKKEVDAWLDDSERMVYSIDSLQNKGVHLFNESEAYQDVYELLTGIEYD